MAESSSSVSTMPVVPSTPDFSALPAEVKRIVCNYVSSELLPILGWVILSTDRAQLPREDLKTLRLANKTWGRVAASVLWYHISLAVDKNYVERLDTLLTSPAASVPLANVKNMRIQPKGHVNSEVIGKALLLLPKDQLKVFHCTGKLDTRTLGRLIQNQTQLEELAVATVSTKRPKSHFIGESLKHLCRLQLELEDSTDLYGSWFEHTPSLRTLCLSGYLKEQLKIKLWTAPSDKPLLKLQVLLLTELDLPGKPGQVGKLSHIPSLRRLRISQCKNLRPFLHSLARDFADHEETLLKKLSIIDINKLNECWECELNLLLESTTGLETLQVETSDANCPSISSICCHGKSLRRFYFSFYANNLEHPHEIISKSEYSTYDLSELVNGCPMIEELSLEIYNLLPKDLDMDTEPYFLLGEERITEGDDAANILVGGLLGHIATCADT